MLRSTFYRQTISDSIGDKQAKLHPPLALDEKEWKRVLDVLHSDRFIDTAPHEVYATRLDEGCYLCSTRTMYRILEDHGEVKERQRQVQRPSYSKPELLAMAEAILEKNGTGSRRGVQKKSEPVQEQVACPGSSTGGGMDQQTRSM